MRNYNFIFLSFLVVDHCFNQPCFKRGACVNSVDGYQCNCHEGFQGRNCQGMCPLYLKKKNKKKTKTKTKTKKEKHKKTKHKKEKKNKTTTTNTRQWIRQWVRNSHTIISGSKGWIVLLVDKLPSKVNLLNYSMKCREMGPKPLVPWMRTKVYSYFAVSINSFK